MNYSTDWDGPGERDHDEVCAHEKRGPNRLAVTQQQMNLILMAVEHGFREHERGKNLQSALAGVFELYHIIPGTNTNVDPPNDGDDYADRAEWKARR